MTPSERWDMICWWRNLYGDWHGKDATPKNAAFHRGFELGLAHAREQNAAQLEAAVESGKRSGRSEMHRMCVSKLYEWADDKIPDDGEWARDEWESRCGDVRLCADLIWEMKIDADKIYDEAPGE